MNDDLTALLKNAFKTAAPSDAGSSDAFSLKPGERRDTAVLFLDLAGFTRLSGTLDHETVHEIARSIMNELVRTAKQFRGYVDKIEGDRIMVLFGAVNSGENDSRTAVLCGFRMLEVLGVAGDVLGSSGVKLGARIGISSGPVTVAPDAIGHLTAMGNTVNMASRMEELAELNSILATDRVHSMCSSCAIWADPVQLQVRGVTDEVTAWKPLEPLRPGCDICDDAAFTGRREEYESLKLALELAGSGDTGSAPGGGHRHILFEITGEAGAGKARLALEFIRNECSGRLVLRGRSVAEGQPAHWLWSSVVSSLLGFQVQKAVSWEEFLRKVSNYCSVERLENSLPFLGKLIPALSGDTRLVNLGNQAITLETRLAVRDFMELLAENRDLVVFLEDTHWMDSTDRDLLDFLVKNCRTRSPVLFILSGRNSDDSAPVAAFRSDSLYSIYRSVELGELTRDECGAMAASIAERYSDKGSHLFSEHALDLLWQHSSGNPFFLRELVLHLLETGDIEQTEGVWRIRNASGRFSSPESLTGLLQSRLDNLPDLWRKTLLLCAVLGTDFLIDTYRMVSSRLDLPMASEEVFSGLMERQMLVKQDTGEMTGYRFRHPLIQRTACESNLASNLKLIHRAAAQAIEELFENDEERISAKLAFHWEGAGETSRAAEWGIIAQKHASDNYQHGTVLYWGEKLLEWLPREFNEYLKVLELNGKAYQYTGRSDLQKDAILEMLKLAEENGLPEWRARALMEMSSLFRASGDMDNALKNCSASLEICRDNDLEELLSNALGNMGVITAAKGDTAGAKEFFTEARNIHRRLGNRRGEASTLGNLGIMSRNMQDSEGAAEYLRGALVIFQELGDIRSEAITLGNLGNISHDNQDYDSALDLYSRAVGIFVRIGDRRSQEIFLGNLGILHADRGEVKEADEFYERALAISMETGNLRSRGWTLSNKALLKLKNGNIEEAAPLYQKALELFRVVRDPRMTAIALGATGYTRYLSGDLQGSLQDMKEALGLVNALKLPRKDFQHTLVEHMERLEADHGDVDLPDLPDHWQPLV